MNNHYVIGIMNSLKHAQIAASLFQKSGFYSETISIITRRRTIPPPVSPRLEATFHSNENVVVYEDRTVSETNFRHHFWTNGWIQICDFLYQGTLSVMAWLRFPDFISLKYEERVLTGYSLVMVRTAFKSRTRRALKIFSLCGAHDVAILPSEISDRIRMDTVTLNGLRGKLREITANTIPQPVDGIPLNQSTTQPKEIVCQNTPSLV